MDVLHHPLFWNSELRLSFLRDASDRVELEDRESESELLKALESIAPVALGGKWDEKMESALIETCHGSLATSCITIGNSLNRFREF